MELFKQGFAYMHLPESLGPDLITLVLLSYLQLFDYNITINTVLAMHF